jgi:hypothetical protein
MSDRNRTAFPEPAQRAFPEVATPGLRSAAPGLLGGLALLLYAVSFFLPALDGVAGYQAFVFALIWFVFLPMWAANPVFWIGLGRLFQGRHGSASRAGLAALLLALSESWMFGRELGVGYLVWVGSMAVLVVAGACGRRDEMPVRCLPARPPVPAAGEGVRIASRWRRGGLRPAARAADVQDPAAEATAPAKEWDGQR